MQNRMKNLFRISSLFLVSFFLILPSLGRADHFIKKTKHTDAVTVMGQTQPATDEEGAVWISKDKMRQNEGADSSILIRLDLNKIYALDHAKKTYAEIDLPIDLENILPAQAKQMFQMMQVSTKVTDTGETKKIKDWNCRKYFIDVSISMMGMNMPMTMEIWTSKDVDIDLEAYKKFSMELLAMNPFTKDLPEEFKKVEGYPVLTKGSIQMMGSESKYQEEVVSVEKKDAPASTYDLPQGYTKTAYNPMQKKR